MKQAWADFGVWFFRGLAIGLGLITAYSLHVVVTKLIG